MLVAGPPQHACSGAAAPNQSHRVAFLHRLDHSRRNNGGSGVESRPELVPSGMGRTNRGERREDGGDVDVESLRQPWLHLRRHEEEESLESASGGGGGITNNAWGRLGTGMNMPLLDYTVPHTATTSDKQQYQYLLPSIIRLRYIWLNQTPS